MGTVALASPVPREQRALVLAMLARLPEFTERLAELISGEEEFYRRVNLVAPQELRKVCRANLERALSSLLGERNLSLEAVRRTGLAQARQGIPLPAVLRAFRISGTFVYETLLEQAGPGFINSAQTVEISSSVWKTIDLYSGAVASVYSEVAAETSRESGQARLDLLDNLLRGLILNQPELEEAARSLDLPSTGTFVVVVGENPTPGRERQGTIEALLRARRWRSVWRPGADTEVGIVVVERVEDIHRLRDELASLSLAAGASNPFTGLPEIPNALNRARAARRSLPPGTAGVVMFGDSPVTTLIATAPPMARDAVRSVLAGVLALPSVERKVLLDTLVAWFAGHGSAKEAADRLFVHPNTVRYRIRRIQDLTKRNLTDPVGIGEIYVALEAVRLEAEPGLG